MRAPGTTVRLKGVLAELLAGRGPRRGFEAAVRDLASMSLPDAVARRTRAPRAGATPGIGIRVFHRALVRVADAAEPDHACLPRSLALYEEARRRGLEVNLVVGVRIDGGDLASHAWLTLDGAPFLEVPETPDRFRTITQLP